MILLSIGILLAPYNIVLSLVQRLLSQLINFVSTYMLQLQLTYQLQSVYYAILRAHLIMGCCTLKVLSNLMPSVIRIGLVALMINALLPDFQFSLEIVLFLGVQRKKLLFPGLVLKLSIIP